MKNRVYILVDNKLFKLKELYFCIICSKIKSDFNLKKEIEYYYCNGCTEIYTKNETSLYSYECLRCFNCPFCFSCLSVAHKNLENSLSNVNNMELKNNEIKDSYTKKNSKRYDNGFTSSSIYKNENEDIYKFFEKNTSNSDYDDKIENNLKKEFISNEENNLKNKFMMNKQNELIKKDKKLFYFKCHYCLWSSIYSIFNTKLDELIGDMIIFEKNCIFRCYFRNILNEIKKSNELLKQKKILKRIDLYSSNHKIENLNSLDDWISNKLSETKNEENKNQFLNGEHSSLICKSKIQIDKISLKDILNGEHIKNDKEFNDIFELQNENVKYLDLIILQNQNNLEDNEVNETTDDYKNNYIENGDNIKYKKEINKENIEVEEKDHNIENNDINIAFEKKDNDDNVEKKDKDSNTIYYNQNYINKKEENNPNKINNKISNLKNNKFSNIIINSKNYLSFEHLYDYPYNFYKGIDELKPLRKKLLAKKSKRCSKCKQYLLKFHNSNLYSTFRLNNNAMKYIPRIYINDFRIIKKKNGILNFVLINPLDFEMNIKIIPQIEHNFLKNLNINKIPINCESKANSFEFIMNTYDEIIDDLLKDENDIKTVITSENIIIKKQNNMALIVISFIYIENPNDFTIENKSNILNEERKDSLEQSINLNFPLILECSFSDKLKKIHKITLNLLFTNDISTNKFYNYLLNS
ncbi:dynactin subunit 4, putative [Plasmodium gallinaceum]|uniref:Dynactin subunit 4 n=1 Tax=Plasmodium gallinaceum TaxID=5849 RepID=A0A1J1GTU2_PLAGA|nr:dynactin subunit 4, putative [Plasmodium gallinaceum]CRG94726.1 dynactin subunit 4, putative [Plasmodium gallinaceum]